MSDLTALPPRIGEMAFSTSSLATYRECPAKYDMSFLRMMAPEGERAPFLIGDLVHRGLEAFHGRREHPQKILERIQDELYAATRSAFVPEESQADLQKETSIVVGMLKGYFRHHGPKEWERWQDVRTELGFDLAWPEEAGGGRMWGQIDMAGSYGPDGQFWVVEHKTTGLSGNEFLMKWHLGFQPHTYVWAARRMHELGILPRRAAGCVINVLKKPGIRLKQTETQEEFNERLVQEYLQNPTKYMAREWIPISDDDVAWFLRNQGEFARRLAGDYARGFFPQNTDSCHTHFGQCKFFPVCVNRDRDPGVYQYFRLKQKSFEEIKSVVATDR